MPLLHKVQDITDVGYRELISSFYPTHITERLSAKLAFTRLSLSLESWKLFINQSVYLADQRRRNCLLPSLVSSDLSTLRTGCLLVYLSVFLFDKS